MRAAGLFCLAAAFLIAGICAVGEKRRRLRGLGELCGALELLQGELELREASLPELCRELKERGTGLGSRLFSRVEASMSMIGEASFSSLWNACVENCCGEQETAVRAELRRMGASLGRYDTGTQLRAIRSCEAALSRRREEQERAFSGERKLWLGLSAAAGALLVLVLI